jgi:uncharacterized protein (DUF433 family)
MNAPLAHDRSLLGIGSYSPTEAGRLLKTPARNIRRWMAGYSYSERGETFHSPPLWTPQLPRFDQDHIEIGFRDLIELRFIKAFLDAGLGLKAIRHCLDYARECIDDERPFSTRRFRTDGKTIFLESLQHAGEDEQLLDLKKRQYTIKGVVEGTFKDLDIEDDVVARWRPFQGKASIILDPTRSFGQPIAAQTGVPTIALADAAEAEGSLDRVARIFEVAPAVVRDAVAFERSLRG